MGPMNTKTPPPPPCPQAHRRRMQALEVTHLEAKGALLTGEKAKQDLEVEELRWRKNVSQS